MRIDLSSRKNFNKLILWKRIAARAMLQDFLDKASNGDAGAIDYSRIGVRLRFLLKISWINMVVSLVRNRIYSRFKVLILIVKDTTILRIPCERDPSGAPTSSLIVRYWTLVVIAKAGSHQD